MSATEPLRHLRASTANKRPTPAAMADGQLALNTNNTSPGLFFKDSNGALVKVGPVHVGTTAPNASPAAGGSTGNAIGEQWLDTAGGTYVFKVWDGSAWRSESGTFVDVNGDVMTGALGIIAGSAGSPGLYFSGDTNTGLYSPGTDQLALATGGTGRIFVNAVGNTGIGTATTNVPLTIQADSGQASIRIAGRSADGLSYAEFTNNAQTLTYGYFSSGPTYLAAGAGTTEAIRISSTGQLQCGTLGTAAAPVISFSADTNTGIYSPGADQVAISTNSVGRLFVDASGNVGVGTSPSQRLHVVGGATTNPSILLAETGGSSLQIISGASDSFIGTNGATPLRLGTGFSERLRITSAGLVGVGTSDVQDQLHVEATNGNGIRLSRNSLADNEASDIDFTYRSGATYYWAGKLRGIKRSGGGGDLQFFTSSDGNAEPTTPAVVIDKQGRLAVGTTSPAEKLHVVGDGVRIDRVGGDPYIDFYTSGSANNVALYGGSSTGFRAFVGGSERLRIDSSGRLLVGTSSSAMSGGVVQQNGNLGIIANTATNVATNGTLDITISNGGSCFTGFMIVENTLDANAASRTQTLYAVMGRGTSATFTSLATANGSTSGASFSLSCPSNGVIRVTNTHGGATNINLCWYGPTGY